MINKRNPATELQIRNEAAKTAFVAWWATMMANGYQYGFSALCNVWVGFDGGRSTLAQKVLEIATARYDYFTTRNPHNGWANNESGPCCEKCRLEPEHLTGRADTLKALAGCRNPFQLAEVCQCHVETRRAVTAGIEKALTQVNAALRELFQREGIEVKE